MKILAALPLVISLISLCGSPVPPPGATITGTVYLDANRNGIRDSCDSDFGTPSVSAIAEDGTRVGVSGDPDGNFTLTKVPRGDVLITLTPATNQVWPITTRTADDRGGVALRLKGVEEVEGVELGVASNVPYSETGHSVSGVVYHDKNENGHIDRDECGVLDASATGEDGSGLAPVTNYGGILDLSPGEYFLTSARTVGRVYPQLFPDCSHEDGSCRSWVPVSQRGSDPCIDGLEPTQGYGGNTHQANIPVRVGSFETSLVATVFDDLDGDGKRNADEQPVEGVSVWLSEQRVHCRSAIAEPSSTLLSDANGEIRLDQVNPGSYQVVPHVTEPGFTGIPVSPLPARPVIIRAGLVPARPVTVRGGEPVHVDVPVAVEPGGLVHVRVFDDTDEDGILDPGEQPVFGTACTHTSGPWAETPGADGIMYAGSALTYGGCTSLDPLGEALVGPLPVGRQELRVTAGELERAPVTVVEVVDGETVETVIAVDRLQPQEQVIAPGEEVASVPLDVCYERPDFIPRSFVDGYDASLSTYQSWGVGEQQVRTMYDQGIYLPGDNSSPLAFHVWALIVGLSTAEMTSACMGPPQGNEYSLPRRLVVSSGFRPVSAAMNSEAGQVLLEPAPGVYGFWLHYAGSPVLFVDTSYQAIMRCSSTGCESAGD